jgi:carbamate kinase
MMQNLLQNELRRAGLERPVVTLITQVVVDDRDPAFRRPTKPIGPFYTEERARQLAREKGWTIVEDAGRGYRRVVPSPEPLEIVEIEAIRRLLKAGAIVIAAGGGGIPVTRQWDRSLHGVEAVIDKDLASSLLARMLGFEVLVLVTGVEKVALDFQKPGQRDLDEVSVDELGRYLAEGHFPSGSMGPKIQAAIGFIRGGGSRVVITTPDRVREALAGKTGTHVHA